MRSNDRFFEELRMSRDDFIKMNGNFMQYIETKSRKALVNAVELAIETGEETACTVHFIAVFHNNREEWLQARFRNLASKFNSHIVYVSISNITAEAILDKALKKERIALENILHFAPGGLAEFIASESNLTRIYTSETAQEILGYSIDAGAEEDFITQLSQIHPDDRDAVRKSLTESIERGAPFSVEFRVILKTGGVRWVNLSANPARIENELHYFGIYTDISRHKAVEIAAKSNIDDNAIGTEGVDSLNTHVLHQYLATTRDYVYIKDTNSNYVAVSESFAKLTGHRSYADLLGKTDHDVYGDNDIAVRIAETDLEVISTGENKLGQTESYSEMGGEHAVLVRTNRFAIRNVKGEIVGMLCVGTDVTTQHTIEEYKQSLESSGRHLYRYVVKGRAFVDSERNGSSSAPMTIKNGPGNAVEAGVVAKEDVERWLGLFDRVDAGERAGTADIRFREEDGTFNWYRVSFKSIPDKSGKPSSAIMTYHDVEKYHRADFENEIARTCVYSSVTALYPSFVVSNLTKNRTRPLIHMLPGAPGVREEKSYDEAVEQIASACLGNGGAAVREAFSRDNLIKAFESGKRIVTTVADMKFDDGSVHAMELVAVHVQDPPVPGEVFSAGLLREL